MADNLTQNGLSTGAFNQPDTGASSFQSVTAPGTRPIDVIQRAQAQVQTLGFLQYPSDLPKYYMGFKVLKYSRESLFSVATTNPINQIALPFPDQMVDDNRTKYDQVQFGAAIGSAVSRNIPAVNELANNPSLEGLSAAKNKASLDANNALAVGVDAVGLSGGVGQGIFGVAGYAPNYFLTVILTGPQYKSYSLSWTFAPRNPTEASQLTQIIRVFKDGMSSGLALGGALFSFPRVFQNYYAPNPGHLYQFKPAVLVDLKVDYSAGGMPAMRRQDPATVWETPAAIKMQATFLELEFWLRSDYGDVSPGASGNQDFSNKKDKPTGAGRDQP